MSFFKRLIITLGITGVVFFLIFSIIKSNNSINSEIIISENHKIDQKLNESSENAQEVIQRNDNLVLLSGSSFEPSNYLENWIKENIRSTSNRIDKVFSPVLGDTIKNNKVMFSWRMAENDKVSIKIMNNLEEEIYKSTADPSQFPNYNIRISSRTIKQSGLYYWQVENEDEVLFTGKFYFLRN